MLSSLPVLQTGLCHVEGRNFGNSFLNNTIYRYYNFDGAQIIPTYKIWSNLQVSASVDTKQNTTINLR